MFKIVDRIAPKRNRARPQFRSQSGTVLDVSEEDNVNAGFLRQLIASSETDCVVPPPVLQCLLTRQEVLTSLEAIPRNKAGPSHIALNVMYRVGARVLAPIIYDFLQAWWTGGRRYIPQAFKDAIGLDPQTRASLRWPGRHEADWIAPPAWQSNFTGSSC